MKVLTDEAWARPFEVMAGTGVMATPAYLKHDTITEFIGGHELTCGEQIFLARHCLLNALRMSPPEHQAPIIEAFAKACLDCGIQTAED